MASDPAVRTCELDDPPGCDLPAVVIAEWDPPLLAGFVGSDEGITKVPSERAFCTAHTPDPADRWKIRPITQADQPK